MNKIARFISLIAVLAAAQLAIAQKTPPTWKSGYFKELNNSYIEVTSATASSIDAARSKAVAEVFNRRNIATGASVQIKYDNNQVVATGSDEIIVKSRILDEYIETTGLGEYKVYLLTQTAKHPQNTFEPVDVTDAYPFSARSFVPGLEQIHKGQKAKGVAFIVGEAACIAGIVVAENMRVSNLNLINSTHDARHRIDYTNKANTWSNVRNGFIAGAAVVYVWNVIDAVASKGGRYVESGHGSLAFAPCADSRSVGFTLNLTF